MTKKVRIKFIKQLLKTLCFDLIFINFLFEPAVIWFSFFMMEKASTFSLLDGYANFHRLPDIFFDTSLSFSFESFNWYSTITGHENFLVLVFNCVKQHK